jgi:ribose transport system substrate-binding protein
MIRSKSVYGVVGVVAIVAMALSACSSSSTASSTTSEAAAASAAPAATSAAPEASSAAASALDVDWGAYCGPDCQAALTLQANASDVSCKVAMLVPATSFPYGAAQFQQAQDNAKKYFPNMELTVLNADGDAATQSNQLDTVVSQGIKTIILDPLVRDALVPSTKKAVDSGADVIVVDRTVNTPVLTTIKAPDVPLGERAGEFIAKYLNGKGKVAILSGSAGASPTIDRTAGFMNVMKQYPDIEIVADVAGDYDTAKAEQATTNLLSRFPKGQLDLIYTHADVMAFGALPAIKAAGRGGDVKLVGIDGQEQSMDAIAAGDYLATVAYPVVQPMAIIAAAKSCMGEPMPSEIALDYPLITADNVAEYKGTAGF